MMLWELRDNENVSRVNWDDLSPTHHMNSFNSALRKLHSSGLVQSVEKNGTVYEISLVDWEDINAHIEG